ncbi:dihydrodipicolinate synthase family protein [Jiangella asiatica]|uniref:Dihydrodipicolinate synthase family protein n=1 Tax=Jiangella asiatica TaxID=2530372 RepID=A0A4V6PFN1_9ACTN|nr:dihydrodipicolinate synthase family protein [Jiangella asiatica]TDE10108.1 dihydrodipicolinate synthase family protein [Jiangella asiatica]
MVSSSDLHGMHVALATPIGDDGEPDPAGLGRLLDRVSDGGIDAVCPTGSTGEGPRLTVAQRRAVTAAVRAHLGTGHLVLSGASAMTPADAVDEIAGLAAAGTDAVLLAPPSYYPMAPAELVAWYRAVAGRTALPIVLYNIPAMTGVTLAPHAVAELAGVPGVVGIKDSSRDLEYLQEVLYATSGADFAVLTGTDTMLLASLTIGAVGAIAASANLVPSLGRAVHAAFVAGDADEAAAAQRRLVDIVTACRRGTTPAGWKAALAWAGVCSANLVPPAAPLPKPDQDALGARLEELGVR